jgi:hypothetical protein
MDSSAQADCRDYPIRSAKPWQTERTGGSFTDVLLVK